MGRGCRGSHRAKRNRKRALQPEWVRPALGFCLLLGKEGCWLDRGTVFGLWVCCCTAPAIRSPIPEQLTLPCGSWWLGTALVAGGARAASPSSPAPAGPEVSSSTPPAQLPAHPSQDGLGNLFPAARTGHGAPGHSRAVGGWPERGAEHLLLWAALRSLCSTWSSWPWAR